MYVSEIQNHVIVLRERNYLEENGIFHFEIFGEKKPDDNWPKSSQIVAGVVNRSAL